MASSTHCIQAPGALRSSVNRPHVHDNDIRACPDSHVVLRMVLTRAVASMPRAEHGRQGMIAGNRGDDWRRELRSKIFWLLMAKGAALFLLWFLFFRGPAS